MTPHLKVSESRMYFFTFYNEFLSRNLLRGDLYPQNSTTEVTLKKLLNISRFATIPLMYPASFLFRVPSVAFVLLACTNLFVGIITTITVVVLENFDDQELQDVGFILKDVFLIFPQYCLGRGLMELAAEYNKNIIAGKFGLVSTR